jgi:ribonuclease HII
MTSLPVRYTQDTSIEAGIDEAGRGCLWGPLYAAAVIWPPESDWLDEHRAIAPFIKDSKKLSAKKRLQVAAAIQDLAIAYGVAQVSAKEIDMYGMTIANKLAFTRAVSEMGLAPDRLLLDGILKLDEDQLQTLNAKEQISIVEGDNSYLPIAAASILAKVTRDSWVETYVEKEPSLETNYCIGSSKGYGTEKHRKGILAHGKHSEHRNLFLRKLLGEQSDCLITDT